MKAIVTGATSGIGAATARALVDAGWDVLGCGRRGARLEAMKDGLGAAFEGLPLDITDRRAVEGVDAARWGCDLLVNNAGLARGVEPLHEADIDDWDAMVATNVQGLLYVTRQVLPGMVARGRGHVVNIGSVAGRWVYPGGAVYCATKHAVRALSEGMRLDVQGSGVRVTNIEPGLVRTEFSEVRFGGDLTRAAAVYEGVRHLTPEDIAQTVLWCVQRPAHVNVQELVVYPTDQAAVRDVVRRH